MLQTVVIAHIFARIWENSHDPRPPSKSRREDGAAIVACPVSMPFGGLVTKRHVRVLHVRFGGGGAFVLTSHFTQSLVDLELNRIDNRVK